MSKTLKNKNHCFQQFIENTITIDDLIYMEAQYGIKKSLSKQLTHYEKKMELPKSIPIFPY